MLTVCYQAHGMGVDVYSWSGGTERLEITV